MKNISKHFALLPAMILGLSACATTDLDGNRNLADVTLDRILQVPDLLLAFASLTILGTVIYDGKIYTKPQVLPLVAIALFVIVAFYVGLPLAESKHHSLLAFIGFSTAVFLLIVGPMRGGDVKLFSIFPTLFTVIMVPTMIHIIRVL